LLLLCFSFAYWFACQNRVLLAFCLAVCFVFCHSGRASKASE
jgi:hypothetical protein